MELCDIYNENWEKTGRIYNRGDKTEKLAPGEYLLAVGCWIFNSQNQIFLTKRSPEKKFAPNQWENTGGHVKSGETGADAIIRELAEEIGLRVAPEELLLFGRSKSEKYLGLEYAIRKDVPIESIKLQPGETCEARWVSEEEFNAMIRTGELARSVTEHLAPLREAFDQILHQKTGA